MNGSSSASHPHVLHTIWLRGDVDRSRADELADLLEQFRRSGASSARVDLAEVGFIDSSGLAFLARLNLACQQRGGHVTLDQPSAAVLQTLRVVGMASAFALAPAT